MNFKTRNDNLTAKSTRKVPLNSVKESKEGSIMEEMLAQTKIGSIPNLGSLNLPQELTDRMFEHQAEGVQWMYGLFLSRSGGILGDDMGLGKTFQVACLLAGLLKSSQIQRVLIIAPVSVLESWYREITQFVSPFVPRLVVEIVGADMPIKKRQKNTQRLFLNSKFKNNNFLLSTSLQHDRRFL